MHKRQKQKDWQMKKLLLRQKRLQKELPQKKLRVLKLKKKQKQLLWRRS